MVGNLEFAATNPDSALDLPAMVMYTSLPASLFSSSIFKTFCGSLWAEAACCSHLILYLSRPLVIFFACGSSAVSYTHLTLPTT